MLPDIPPRTGQPITKDDPSQNNSRAVTEVKCLPLGKEVLVRETWTQYIDTDLASMSGLTLGAPVSDTWLSLQCGSYLLKSYLAIEYPLNFIILCHTSQNVNLLLKALTINDSSREAPPLL